jgi:DNA-binding CsgD family transcriptional regulator
VVLTLYKISSIQNEKEKEALVLQKEMELEDQKAKSGQVINELRNRRLKDEIVHKNKELASATMHLVQKAKVLQGIRDVLKQLDIADEDVTKKEIRNIIKTINNDIKLDKTWQQFERHFDQVHVDFLKRLRDQFPKLTPNDQKLCAYLRMNLTTKEIATIMNISVRGVEISRYRLRKKLALDTEVNLTEYILNL